tara:strand:+ start:645 stop:755 length:111 start_codon:yes stop_codon:yes gene_type:complete
LIAKIKEEKEVKIRKLEAVAKKEKEIAVAKIRKIFE